MIEQNSAMEDIDITEERVRRTHLVTATSPPRQARLVTRDGISSYITRIRRADLT
jgi:hypothetical protein